MFKNSSLYKKFFKSCLAPSVFVLIVICLTFAFGKCSSENRITG